MAPRLNTQFISHCIFLVRVVFCVLHLDIFHVRAHDVTLFLKLRESSSNTCR